MFTSPTPMAANQGTTRDAILMLYEHFTAASQVLTLPLIESIARTVKTSESIAMQSLVFAYLADQRFDDVLRLLCEIDERGLEHAYVTQKLTEVAIAVRSTEAHFAPPTAPAPEAAIAPETSRKLTDVLKRLSLRPAAIATDSLVAMEADEEDTDTLPDMVKNEIAHMRKQDLSFAFHRTIRDMVKYTCRSERLPSPHIFRHCLHLLAVIINDYDIHPLDATYFVMLERAPTTEMLFETVRIMQSMRVFNPRLATVCAASLQRLGHPAAAKACLDLVDTGDWNAHAERAKPKGRASYSSVAITRALLCPQLRDAEKQEEADEQPPPSPDSQSLSHQSVQTQTSTDDTAKTRHNRRRRQRQRAFKRACRDAALLPDSDDNDECDDDVAEAVPAATKFAAPISGKHAPSALAALIAQQRTTSLACVPCTSAERPLSVARQRRGNAFRVMSATV